LLVITYSGTAEAGSTVTVYASDGTTVLGTAIADGSGNYTVTMSPAQSDGASISVTATDTSGNVSAVTTATVSNSVLSSGDAFGIEALNVYKANSDSFVTIAGKPRVREVKCYYI